MSHPCDGHPCDHCYQCDVLGICCMTVTEPQHVSAAQASVIAQPDVLHDAVVQDAKSAISLRELVRIEAQRPHLAGLLLPHPDAEPVPNDSRKEAIRVLAARTTR
jgi:hypothetical protein